LRWGAAITAAATVVFAVAASAGPSPLGTVTEYSSGVNPKAGLVVGITESPDGNIWFADKGSTGPSITPAIGMINPSTGKISEFSVAASGGNAGSLPSNSIAVGPDGNIWFPDAGTPPAIGMINPTTDKVSEFSAGLNAGSHPLGVAAGPDGNVWFSDQGTTPAIGMINPTSDAITEYDIGPAPLHGGPAGSVPGAVAAGPDENIWFTDSDAGVSPATPGIGMICLTVGPLCSATAVAGRAISEFRSGLNAGSVLEGIATGPDGNLWFTDRGGIKAVGKINPATGAITEFSNVTPSVLSGAGTGMLSLSQAATASGTVTLQFSTSLSVKLTAGSKNLTVTGSFPANVLVGMTIVGTNIPAGTTVSSVSGGTLTMSNAALTNQPSEPVSFLTSVSNVTTAAGSTSVSVSSGVFPNVTGDAVSGPGIPVGILNPGAVPGRITAGPDGNMWFADAGTAVTPATPAIGMINPTTDKVTEFTQPAGMNAGSNPHGITVGPDGNLWFPDTGTTKAIGKFGLGVAAASVTAPAVTGTDGVGVAQSCGGDVWSTWAGQQPSHSAFGWDGYKWLLDGSPIAGASGASYTPTAADAGHLLACEATVTYTLLFDTVSATSTAVEVKGAAEQLAELAAAVVDVGPGHSLARKVAAIQDDVAASDTAEACSALGAFGNEVDAQTGKKLSTTQAASFDTQAQDIEAALGC
jgi:streptogramin lyase